MNHCNYCNSVLGSSTRWLLVDEMQVVIQRPNVCPEVDIADAVVIGTYCSESHACEAAEDLLQNINATATWADVDPIESCACCGKEFDTSLRHRVLTLSEESGPEDTPEVIDVKYAGRFCVNCSSISIFPASREIVVEGFYAARDVAIGLIEHRQTFEIVPATEPGNSTYRFVVSSNTPDSAFPSNCNIQATV